MCGEPDGARVRVAASYPKSVACGKMLAMSGTPLTITAGSDRNLDGNNNDRANLVGDPRLDAGRPRSALVDQFFNTAAFAQPANGTTGTAGRNIIDGPGLKNVDLGIFRDFRPAEKMTLQFRGEMSNAFNLVNLSNPGTGSSSSRRSVRRSPSTTSR